MLILFVSANTPQINVSADLSTKDYSYSYYIDPQNPIYLQYTLPSDAEILMGSTCMTEGIPLFNFNSPVIVSCGPGLNGDSSSNYGILKFHSEDFIQNHLSGSTLKLELPITTSYVQVKLPKSSSISNISYDPIRSLPVYPPFGNITFDGERYTLFWGPEDLLENNLIFVDYTVDRTWIYYLLGVGIILFFALFAFVLFKMLGHKKKVKNKNDTPKQTENLLKTNLPNEEKTIIDILLSGPKDGTWQKQLQLQTGLSKVMLSRKLRSLEEKGIIQRIPIGNSNKIHLNKLDS
jgi:hypothetical protein